MWTYYTDSKRTCSEPVGTFSDQLLTHSCKISRVHSSSRKEAARGSGHVLVSLSATVDCKD